MSLAVVVVILWFVGFGFGGHGGWVFGHGYAPRGSSSSSPNQISTAFNANVAGSGLKVLDALNKQDYIGQPFQIQNIPIQELVNAHALWVGETHQSSMLVVTSAGNPISTSGSERGTDWADVQGNVKKAPDAATAQRTWGLSNEDVQTLEQQGAYVEASQVRSLRH